MPAYRRQGLEESDRASCEVLSAAADLLGTDIDVTPEDHSDWQPHPVVPLEILRLLEEDFPADADLSRSLLEAPRWLLKFTGAHYDAGILGFELPELSRNLKLGREARRDRDRWPYLPVGTVDAGGACDEPDHLASIDELLERNVWTVRLPFAVFASYLRRALQC